MRRCLKASRSVGAAGIRPARSGTKVHVPALRKRVVNVGWPFAAGIRTMAPSVGLTARRGMRRRPHCRRPRVPAAVSPPSLAALAGQPHAPEAGDAVGRTATMASPRGATALASPSRGPPYRNDQRAFLRVHLPIQLAAAAEASAPAGPCRARREPRAAAAYDQGRCPCLSWCSRVTLGGRGRGGKPSGFVRSWPSLPVICCVFIPVTIWPPHTNPSGGGPLCRCGRCFREPSRFANGESCHGTYVPIQVAQRGNARRSENIFPGPETRCGLRRATAATRRARQAARAPPH